LASAGHGYVWPDVKFTSDDVCVNIAWRESAPKEFETIHFIGSSSTSVSLPGFERSVGDFVELVLSRLTQVDLPDTELHRLWRSLGEERRGSNEAFLRGIEARLGYDAELAGDEVLAAFERLAAQGGRSAAEEIAAIFNADIGGGLADFESLASGPGIPATAPLRQAAPFSSVGSESPWELGRSRASWARDKLGLRQSVLQDEVLAGLFKFSDSSVFSQQHAKPSSPLGLAVRERRKDSLKLVFRGWRRVSRRFELARFLYESMFAPDEDVWLPSTSAATARQMAQRAFAAEFLMPIEDLKQVAGPDFDSEPIENAAEIFGVSPLAARSHLANNNLIARF
jgi:hypothetical protein